MGARSLSGHSGEVIFKTDCREVSSERLSWIALTSGGDYWRAFVSIMLIIGVVTGYVLSC